MRVYVGNLSPAMTADELRELARPFGEPESVHVATRFADGVSRGFGFLEYADPETARAAITGLEGREVGGRLLKARAASIPEACDPAGLLRLR